MTRESFLRTGDAARKIRRRVDVPLGTEREPVGLPSRSRKGLRRLESGSRGTGTPGTGTFERAIRSLRQGFALCQSEPLFRRAVPFMHGHTAVTRADLCHGATIRRRILCLSVASLLSLGLRAPGARAAAPLQIGVGSCIGTAAGRVVCMTRRCAWNVTRRRKRSFKRSVMRAQLFFLFRDVIGAIFRDNAE